MKSSLVLISLLLISLASAQSDKNVEDHQFKINFLFPGIIYEVGIQKNSTLKFKLGTAFVLGLNSESDVDFGFFPFVETQYRRYYNFNRRLKKVKNIESNTANYVGLTTVYTI
jgi:TATA-box binding protein (TBP) (component of TFIID and TFIIIB)